MHITHFLALFTWLYPVFLALIFTAFVSAVRVPAKGLFVARALAALAIAVFLAHLNRIFGLWPAHLLFPSGHTTFCAGLSWSLAMVRRWTLFATIPLLITMGTGLVLLGFHTLFDVAGAFPLTLLIYGLVHAAWRLPGDIFPSFTPPGTAAA